MSSNSVVCNIFKDDSALTMSSREIAALTGKQHKNVIRDIQTMLAELQKHSPNLSNDDSTGVRVDRDYWHFVSEIHLPKHECLTLLCGYSVIQATREFIKQCGAYKEPTESGKKSSRSSA